MNSGQTALGRLLSDRRNRLGYSRARLAELCGINAFTIHAWESGKVTKPPIHDVLRLARALAIGSAEIEHAVFLDAPAPSGPEPRGRWLLEQALELFGWDESDIADALGVRPEQVSAWRREAQPMSLGDIMAVTTLIGLRVASAEGLQLPFEHAASSFGGLLGSRRRSSPSRDADAPAQGDDQRSR